jgi:hypothetical protein
MSAPYHRATVSPLAVSRQKGPYSGDPTLNLTATAGDPAQGAPTVLITNQVQINDGPGILVPLLVDATHARPGTYQLQLSATDPATNVTSNTPARGLLITTPAADFNTGTPAHFRMIFHNLGSSTLQITSGAATFFLAPGDVLAADLCTQFDVVATVYDGAAGSLEIGYP